MKELKFKLGSWELSRIHIGYDGPKGFIGVRVKMFFAEVAKEGLKLSKSSIESFFSMEGEFIERNVDVKSGLSGNCFISRLHYIAGHGLNRIDFERGKNQSFFFAKSSGKEKGIFDRLMNNKCFIFSGFGALVVKHNFTYLANGNSIVFGVKGTGEN